MLNLPFIDLPPLCGAGGTIRLPGSKSISNRALLLAGLAHGTTTIRGLLESDDTGVMLDALRTLGCGVDADGSACRITGIDGRLSIHAARLHLGNAGTAMRPLAAALAVLAATQGGRFELSGVPRMHERPIGDLVDALRPLGCHIDWLGEAGFPPLAVHGQAGGSLSVAAPIRVRGDVSSQFLTALLIAMPLVAIHDVVIEVDGDLISQPYVEITLKLLERFGVGVVRDGWQRFTIAAGSAYRSPGDLRVEGDASAASYFIALGAIGATAGRSIRIEGIGLDSIQGDVAFADAARAMGADVRMGRDDIEVKRGRWPFDAITLDCNRIPDAAMTLATMGLYANGPTRLTNIASWRVKETDRIAAMATELRRVGADVTTGADFIEVTPPKTWRPATIHTYDDHRIAMCMSLAAFGGVPLRILDPRCVGKTFPDYFELLFDLVDAERSQIPVIAIDGPTASGKGTLAVAVASGLGYHVLDSGALYRATALAALRAGVAASDESGLERIASTLPLRFDKGRALLAGEDVTDALRDEAVGAMASRVSAQGAVRRALHEMQLSFRRVPGLVADGRDMGSVVFPDAQLKVFLTASAAQRAERRHKQLISKGISASIDALRADLEARDERDRSRLVSPLKAAEDALSLDNSALSIEQSVALVLSWWQQRRPFSES